MNVHGSTLAATGRRRKGDTPPRQPGARRKHASLGTVIQHPAPAADYEGYALDRRGGPRGSPHPRPRRRRHRATAHLLVPGPVPWSHAARPHAGAHTWPVAARRASAPLPRPANTASSRHRPQNFAGRAAPPRTPVFLPALAHLLGGRSRLHRHSRARTIRSRHRGAWRLHVPPALSRGVRWATRPFACRVAAAPGRR